MKKLSLEKPKILLINFDYNCDKLKELQEVIGIENTETEIISNILNQLQSKSMFSLMLGLLLKETFDYLTLEDNFVNEVNLIKDEYFNIAFKLIKQLENFDCFNNDILPYNFVSLLDKDTLVLHIVKPEDI